MTTADNLASNLDRVAYTDYFNTDKIIGTYTGTINVASAGIAASSYAETSVGASLSGKCFIHLIWSVDGGTTWQDGDSTIRSYSGGTLQYDFQATAYSTSSDIFIVTANNGEAASAPAQTLTYKVVAVSIS